MESIDTLIEARWIVPVTPAGVTLEEHALAIADGRIVGVCPVRDARERYAADVTHRLGDHALIPGFVNTHTHAAMTLFRGLADDLPLMEWLERHIWPAETQWVSEAFVRDGTRLAVAEMLRGGTTCFNDMYFFPDESARAASGTGIRATVGLIVIDFSTVWAGHANEYIAKGIGVHDQFRNDPLVKVAFAPHAPYTVSDEPLQRIGVLAEELDIPVHIHLHETHDEVARSLARFGERPLARLDRLGLLSPHLLAVHMTQLEDAEIQRIADCGAHVVHCPESNLKMASGFCPVERLVRAGTNVALGTDGAASNNDLDMMGEMRTAALLAKAVCGEASALRAAQALEMATLGGARALGLEDSIGTLEAGKEADIVAVDLATIETEPLYHPISQIVYAAGRAQITDVWVAGRHLLKERVLLTQDEAAIRARAHEWRGRILRWA
ncbi:MAG: TRZ/ATZ family hydrolase [Gammaproteobacteria bacterium]|nr:TRZ/ATZ family hydrolase [Gammaproteobacteria bacterium]NIR82481.1 TRZ/ATZ family hydrolase [Gammaproteobacteria bacterium]NIR88477.1 TRZ/ATZ family hydrolase [Gammaproteobacteria bacterium]NIU03617.1 TRZ/ATZ family hydrolase [Gammaproteobacteria bacterium]NIV50969.1 TRZ/ATZ family hydrolase [Gammaproteobacteria bacterium]